MTARLLLLLLSLCIMTALLLLPLLALVRCQTFPTLCQSQGTAGPILQTSCTPPSSPYPAQLSVNLAQAA
jgi:hypothetical protein